MEAFLEQRKTYGAWVKYVEAHAKLQKAMEETCARVGGQELAKSIARIDEPITASVLQYMAQFQKTKEESVAACLKAGILVVQRSKLLPNLAKIRSWTLQNGAWQLAEHLCKEYTVINADIKIYASPRKTIVELELPDLEEDEDVGIFDKSEEEDLFAFLDEIPDDPYLRMQCFEDDSEDFAPYAKRAKFEVEW